MRPTPDRTWSVHVFENGVRVFKDHLNPGQLSRYEACNLHEPAEEPLFLNLLDRIRPEGVFANVGSAIGYYLILASLRRPDLTLHGFEPLQRHRQQMKENFALNNLDESNIRLHREALWPSTGTATLAKDSYASRLVHDGPLFPMRYVKNLLGQFLHLINRSYIERVAVPTVSLEDALRRTGAVDLIQLDVQGAEESILKGAGQALQPKNVRRWLIGTHGESIHQTCRALLQDAGYRIAADIPNPPQQPDGILAAVAAN